MKSIKNLFFPSFVLLLLMAACTDLDELNTDPNNPEDVPPSLLLPSIQGGFAYGLGGDLSHHVDDIMQQSIGSANQWIPFHSYEFAETDFDNVWRFNLYAGPMNDANVLINKTEGTSPHYVGVGQVMAALMLGVCTDLWGDVPFSDAFKGGEEGVLQPAYDSQEDVYTTIEALLDNGIVNLQASESGVSPSGDDLVYGGDLSSWVRLANGLKARLYIHTSHKDVADAQKALDAVQSGLASWGDDAELMFGTAPLQTGPHYQFNQQREGNIVYTGTYLEALMTSLGDDRIAPFLYDGPYGMGSAYGSPSSAIPFFTYAEQKFIEAEALLRTGGDPYDAYIEAITASFEKLGLDPTDYLGNSDVDPGQGNITLQHIIEQKYIALFTQPEIWTDWRRTGFPAIQPVIGSEIPRRLPYPESERLYNTNTPAGLTKYSRVWWDQL